MLTPVNFLLLFFFLAMGGWLTSKFTAKVVAMLISVATGNSVSFRFIGLLRVKDFSIQFKKGPIASLTVGQIKGNCRETLSPVLRRERRDFKLRFALSDLEIVLRPTTSTPRKRKKTGKTARDPKPSGRGKWYFVVNFARIFHFSVNDITVRTTKVPDASLQIKELDLDIYSVSANSTSLNLKLEAKPWHIVLKEEPPPPVVSGPTSPLRLGSGFLLSAPKPPSPEDSPPLFSLEHLVIDVQLDHERDCGTVIKHFKVNCGEARFILDERLLDLEIEPSPPKQIVVEENVDAKQPPGSEQASPPAARQQQENTGSAGPDKNNRAATDPAASVSKWKAPNVPEEIGFELPLLYLRCKHTGHGLDMENSVKGIKLSGSKTQPTEADPLPRLDMELDFADVQLGGFPEGTMLEILRVSVAVSIFLIVEHRGSGGTVQAKKRLGQNPVEGVQGQVSDALDTQGLDASEVQGSNNLDKISLKTKYGSEAALSLETSGEGEQAQGSDALRKAKDDQRPLDEEHVGPTPANIDIELGGTTLAIMPTSLAPWIDFGLSVLKSRKLKSLHKQSLAPQESEGKPSASVSPTALAVPLTTNRKGKGAWWKRNLWNATMSVPEAMLILYGTDGRALYRAYSQTVKFFGGVEEEPTGVRVHGDLSEFQVNMADEEQVCLEDVVLGGEANPACLMRISRIFWKWGMEGRDRDSDVDFEEEEDGELLEKLTLLMEVTGGGVYLNLPRLRALASNAKSLKDYSRRCKRELGGSTSMRARGKRGGGKAKKAGQGKNGAKCVKLQVRDFSMHMDRPMTMETEQVLDPKGRLMGSRPDEDLSAFAGRSADVMPAEWQGVVRQSVMCRLALELTDLEIVRDKDMREVRATADRFRIRYRESGMDGEASAMPLAEVVVFGFSSLDVGVNMESPEDGTPMHLVISSSGMEGRWEPDVHLFLNQLMLDAKTLSAKSKGQEDGDAGGVSSVAESNGVSMEGPASDGVSMEGPASDELTEGAAIADKELLGMVDIRRDTERDGAFVADDAESGGTPVADVMEPLPPPVIAIDMEALKFEVGAGDGVEFVLILQAVFSEDARIVVLLENVAASINEAVIFTSDSLQVFRLPSPQTPVDTEPEMIHRNSRALEISALNMPGVEVETDVWDWVIQATGMRVTLPYKLELRGVEDSVEDGWRALKLALLAQRKAHGLPPRPPRPRTKEGKRSPVGEVKICARDIILDIEEDPFQGWLDLHQKLLQKHVREMVLREELLDEEFGEDNRPERRSNWGKGVLPRSRRRDSSSDKKMSGEDDVTDGSEAADESPIRAGTDNWSELRAATARAYMDTVKRDVSPLKDGWMKNEFQLPKSRRAVLAIKASLLEVVLRAIPGGFQGMEKIVHDLDSAKPGTDAPISRILGRYLELNATEIYVHLRDYPYPLLGGEEARCHGEYILAQQATVPPPQIVQEVYIGRWRKVHLKRTASGMTPPMKMYSALYIEFEKSRISYGVGYEPTLVDVSYAFTVALRRAVLSKRNPGACLPPPPPKKERNLPWWDDVRYYVHGRNTLVLKDLKWHTLATADPYEEDQVMLITSSRLTAIHTAGKVAITAAKFRAQISSGDLVMGNSDNRFFPDDASRPLFLEAPIFMLEIAINWQCGSGDPFNHYLHALPQEKVPRPYLYDPFRSTSMTLGWNFKLRPFSKGEKEESSESSYAEEEGDYFSDLAEGEDPAFQPLSAGASKRDGKKQHRAKSSRHSRGNSFGMSITDMDVIFPKEPTLHLGPHNIVWVRALWDLLYFPPMKIRMYSRWPRFGVPRAPRSGNLSMDKLLMEMMMRIDSTPTVIKHVSITEKDPAEGLTFIQEQFKYEVLYSRHRGRLGVDVATVATVSGKPLDPKDPRARTDALDCVFQGLDLRMLKAILPDSSGTTQREMDLFADQRFDKLMDPYGRFRRSPSIPGMCSRQEDREFMLSTYKITIRRQSPKADLSLLAAWNLGDLAPGAAESGTVRARNRSGVSGGDVLRSEESDDDGFSVVLADDCLRVCVYYLRLLWSIKIRNAVWAWAESIGKAFEAPKPSPSRQLAQRKRLAEQSTANELSVVMSDTAKAEVVNSGSEDLASPTKNSAQDALGALSNTRTAAADRDASPPNKVVFPPTVTDKDGWGDDGDGIMHFMVNVIQPQFNFHSDEAHGRFLLAASSGRVLARSFQGAMDVAGEMLSRANLGDSAVKMDVWSWRRHELWVMLENVQAHVAPTDVDPGAGIQWLQKAQRGELAKPPSVLLETVFEPCTMYFKYTKHKGTGRTDDGKVSKPKTFLFNSPGICAKMTSRQFSILADIISNLLLAHLPESRRSGLRAHRRDGDDLDESLDEEEDYVGAVDMAKVEKLRLNLEEVERECRMIMNDFCSIQRRVVELDAEEAAMGNGESYEVESSCIELAQKLEMKLKQKHQARRVARNAVSLCLKNSHQETKSTQTSKALHISWVIDRATWSLLCDGEQFAQANIQSMVLNLDRGLFHSITSTSFTTRMFEIKNLLPNPKNPEVLSPWNAPQDWGKNSMLSVDAEQGQSKEDGIPSINHLVIKIHPLRIYLTDRMFNNMWEYFFPSSKEESDTQMREEFVKPKVPHPQSGSRKARRRSSVSSVSSVADLGPSSSSSSLAVVTSGLVRSESDSSVLTSASVAAGGSSALTVVKSSETRGELAVERSADVADSSRSRGRRGSISGAPSMHRLGEDELMLDPGTIARVGSIGNSGQLALATGASSGYGALVPAEPKVKDVKKSSNKKAVAQSDQQREDSKSAKRLHFKLIKLCQVELLVTYEGLPLPISVNDRRLLMDTFIRQDFTGTWRRLFWKVRSHIIWGFLKSFAGLQDRKFMDAVGKPVPPQLSNHSFSHPDRRSKDAAGGAHAMSAHDNRSDGSDSDQCSSFYPSHGAHYASDRYNFSDSGTNTGYGSTAGGGEQQIVMRGGFVKDAPGLHEADFQEERAGEGFVSSIKGLFMEQKKKARAFMRKHMRVQHELGEQWIEEEDPAQTGVPGQSGGKTSRLLRRHGRKLRVKANKAGKGMASLAERLKGSARHSSPQNGGSSPESSEDAELDE